MVHSASVCTGSPKARTQAEVLVRAGSGHAVGYNTALVDIMQYNIYSLMQPLWGAIRTLWGIIQPLWGIIQYNAAPVRV